MSQSIVLAGVLKVFNKKFSFDRRIGLEVQISNAYRPLPTRKKIYFQVHKTVLYYKMLSVYFGSFAGQYTAKL